MNREIYPKMGLFGVLTMEEHICLKTITLPPENPTYRGLLSIVAKDDQVYSLA
jgi:hypothetical protein